MKTNVFERFWTDTINIALDTLFENLTFRPERLENTQNCNFRPFWVCIVLGKITYCGCSGTCIIFSYECTVLLTRKAGANILWLILHSSISSIDISSISSSIRIMNIFNVNTKLSYTCGGLLIVDFNDGFCNTCELAVRFFWNQVPCVLDVRFTRRDQHQYKAKSWV